MAVDATTQFFLLVSRVAISAVSGASVWKSDWGQLLCHGAGFLGLSPDWASGACTEQPSNTDSDSNQKRGFRLPFCL